MSNVSSNISGFKRKTTLNNAKDVIFTEILYHYLNKDNSLVVSTPPTIYIEGTMGIGKTKGMESVREKLSQVTGEEWGLISLCLAGMSGTDLQGIPIPKKEDDQDILVWVKDSLLPGIKKSSLKHGLLFLDEINQVEDNSVISLLYQLLLEKHMNDYVLPEGWVIVAAGNRAEDGGVYNRLKAPIRDRMLILEIELSQQEWLEWARSAKVHPAVVSYVENGFAGSQVLHTYNPELEEDGDENCANYVFATPRSWEQVSRELMKYEQNLTIPVIGGRLYKPETLELAVCGLLGSQIGTSFFTHYMTVGNVNIADYLNIQWTDNNPNVDVSNLNLSDATITYVVTNIKYKGDLQDIIKMIYLTLFINRPALVKYLISDLSAEEQAVFRDDVIRNRNNELISNLNNTLALAQ